MTAVLTTAKKYQIPAIALTIAGAVLLPVLVHLIPTSAGEPPMGARLLPAFYAPLLAIFLASPLVAVVASLVAPLLNNLLTGNPPSPLVLPLTLELLVFSIIVGVVAWRLPKSPLRMVIAPIAYIVAKLVSSVIQQAPFFDGLTLALPGIILLLVLNIAVVRFADSRG